MIGNQQKILAEEQKKFNSFRIVQTIRTTKLWTDMDKRALPYPSLMQKFLCPLKTYRNQKNSALQPHQTKDCSMTL